MIRRLLKARKRRRKEPRRPRRAALRRLSLQTLEERALLAVLTNGQGDGQVMVEVNEEGAFGFSTNLAVNIPNRPAQNDVTDAFFNPSGPRISFGTTYESGLAIRVGGQGARDFITAGTIGNTGNNVNGFFFDPGILPANNLERNSRFFWPNNVARPTNAPPLPLETDPNDPNFVSGSIPAGARFVLDLKQTLVDLNFMGAQDGTALVQEYTIENISGGTLDFELVRYWDGDLFDGAGNTPLMDGGGERIFDIRRGVNSVWQTDTANNTPINDVTFHEIQSSLTAVPTASRWEVGLAGNARPNKPIGPLLQSIIAGNPLANDITPAAADGDGNNARDVGQDADVAVGLRQAFSQVPNEGLVVFTSTTVFGHPPRGTPPPPTPQFGAIEGFKYLDRNANAVRDPGEPGVPNFLIYADLNTNGVRDAGEPFTVTDQDGFYSLNVPIGMHRIREVVPPNWTQTGPIAGPSTIPQVTPMDGFYVVDVQMAGQTIPDPTMAGGPRDGGPGVDFGNVPDPGEIHGRKFDDDNRNGVQDANEPAFPNVTIYLDLDDDGVFDPTEPSDVTNAQGNYDFLNLEPGEYIVREVIPAGYEQTVPGGDGAHRVTIDPGQILTGVNFGNRLRRGSIRGVVYNDLNDDGARQSGEPRLSGVVVYIDENKNGHYNFGERAAITNTLGEYVIDELLPGEYIVRQIALPGTALSEPSAGFHQVVVFPGLPTPFVNFGNTVRFDFGDAPESYGTLLKDNGARHSIVTGFHLGPTIDGEPDGQPSLDATGDDFNGGGFGAPVHFAVGDRPVDVLLADVTGDGILDVITANAGSDNVSVAAGFGDGTFGPAFDFDVEANPVAVFAADFNGDGLLDLAVAHGGDNDVGVLINLGAGIFDDVETFPAGGAQSDIVAFDYDGDGDIDIAVTRPNTDDVVILPNVSNPALDFDPVAPATTFPVGDNPVKLKLGRINSDALLDLVVVNRDSDNISVLRNLGAGFLATAVNYMVGTNPNDVVIADLDDDIDRDLAVANETSGDVTVLINNGFGVFPNATKMTYPVPGMPVAITAGNFDGQLGLDLAVALQQQDAVAVLSNDGAGMFPAAAVFPTGRSPAAIASANLDGDGITDIVTANSMADSVSVLGFSGSDEDGVTFASPLAPGGVTQVTINASAPGIVSAWIDFNRNGVFDAADRVLTDVAVVAGDNQFFIPTPAGIADGPVFARFRFSNQAGLGPIGPALSGEVEDYQIQVQTGGGGGGGGGGPNSGWTNLANPEDVDANGRVDLFDALLLINDLRINGFRVLPPVINPPPPPPFLDVNGNGSVELNDVLRVLNRIIQQNAAEGEREADDPFDALDSTLDDIAPDVCAAMSDR